MLLHLYTDFLPPASLCASIRSGEDVHGLTVVNDKIFIVAAGSERIKVFSRFADELEDIVVENMEYPTDIVGNSETMKLYVADTIGSTIWRIDLAADNHVSEFVDIEDHVSLSLSLSPRYRLCVTSACSKSVFVYDAISGQQLEHVELPSFMWLRNATETRRGTFILCHRGRDAAGEDNADHDRVSEVDRVGRVIRSYGDRHGCVQHQLNLQHLAMDSFGRVLVADPNFNRIVLLTEELEFNRILLEGKRGDFHGWPVRLSFNEEDEYLVVGMKDGTINVFNCQLNCQDNTKFNNFYHLISTDKPVPPRRRKSHTLPPPPPPLISVPPPSPPSTGLFRK